MKSESGDNLTTHEFGITSLKNKRDLLQKDDIVTFKIDEANRAVEVSLIFSISCYTFILKLSL